VKISLQRQNCDLLQAQSQKGKIRVLLKSFKKTPHTTIYIQTNKKNHSTEKRQEIGALD